MKKIYDQLTKIAAPILKHWTEDLTEHDLATIQHGFRPGQVWLWGVRPTGTYLVRWDEDPNAGTKQSFLECLIRGTLRGHLETSQWHLIRVHHDKRGVVSGSLDPKDLARMLPRPRPTVKLPGEKVNA